MASTIADAGLGCTETSALCLHCGEPQASDWGDKHPLWRECVAPCVICRATSHQGKLCPFIYATKNQIKRISNCSDDLHSGMQVCPTEDEARILASVYGRTFFRNWPYGKGRCPAPTLVIDSVPLLAHARSVWDVVKSRSQRRKRDRDDGSHETPMEKRQRSGLQTEHTSGRSAEYNEGFEAGRQAGWREGYNEGFQARFKACQSKCNDGLGGICNPLGRDASRFNTSAPNYDFTAGQSSPRGYRFRGANSRDENEAGNSSNTQDTPNTGELRQNAQPYDAAGLFGHPGNARPH